MCSAHSSLLSEKCPKTCGMCNEVKPCIPPPTKSPTMSPTVPTNSPTKSPTKSPTYKCPQGFEEYRDKCVTCERGKYGNTVGGCSDCPPGKYQPAEGQKKCFNCYEGSYSYSSKMTMCTPCSIGKTSTEGSSSCTDCPENYYGSTNGQISYCSKCSSDRPSTCGKTGSTSFSSCSLPKDSCIQCGYNTEYENHKCCGAYSNQVKSWKKVNGCSQCRTELLCK